MEVIIYCLNFTVSITVKKKNGKFKCPCDKHSYSQPTKLQRHASKNCAYLPTLEIPAEIMDTGPTLVENGLEQREVLEPLSSNEMFQNTTQQNTENELTQGDNIQLI
jgi:hypothetical protein